ncbi:hypothetical protein RN22_20010 [Grimontia sp. AD028]|uniref:DsbE family thiol:disulfide interchange protein n=1 Tax=Grimontia sp. AD028 TaxID=1581149 RepID=UPI00061A9A6C|nr:DsbE family thiol:disulfide interchange protein [Grimontia sp. AD028]KKD58650.1 hypothetical protein RN22_20010 [Grimontia sp. AD028]
MKYKLLLPLIGGFALSTALFWGLQHSEDPNNNPPFAMKGKPVPQFLLTSLRSGESVDQTLFQNDWLLLNIWASWCSSCKAEHPYLMSLKSAGIPIVGLNYRDKKNAAISVLKETGDPYQTVIYDPQGSLALELGSIVTPETYLIDREGTLMFRHIGILDEGIWQREFQPRIDDITSKKEGS